MRRVAVTLDALAFLWACAATSYLLMASSSRGIATSAMLGTVRDGTGRLPPSLATANGVWMAAVFMGLAFLAGMPLGIALAHPAGHRRTAGAVACLLLGFCLLSGYFVGLLFLPSAIMLLVAGFAWSVQPRTRALATRAD